MSFKAGCSMSLAEAQANDIFSQTYVVVLFAVGGLLVIVLLLLLIIRNRRSKRQLESARKMVLAHYGDVSFSTPEPMRKTLNTTQLEVFGGEIDPETGEVAQYKTTSTVIDDASATLGRKSAQAGIFSVGSSLAGWDLAAGNGVKSNPLWQSLDIGNDNRVGASQSSLSSYESLDESSDESSSGMSLSDFEIGDEAEYFGPIATHGRDSFMGNEDALVNRGYLGFDTGSGNESESKSESESESESEEVVIHSRKDFGLSRVTFRATEVDEQLGPAPSPTLAPAPAPVMSILKPVSLPVTGLGSPASELPRTPRKSVSFGMETQPRPSVPAGGANHKFSAVAKFWNENSGEKATGRGLIKEQDELQFKSKMAARLAAANSTSR